MRAVARRPLLFDGNGSRCGITDGNGDGACFMASAILRGRIMLRLDRTAHEAHDLKAGVAMVGARMRPTHVAQADHQNFNGRHDHSLTRFVVDGAARGRPELVHRLAGTA